MNKIIRPFILLIVMMLSPPVIAEQVRQLIWKDLIPAQVLSEDPLAHLTLDQQDLVAYVIYMLENLPERGPETEEFYEEVDEAMPMLKKYDIDIVEVMAKRNELRTATVEELNGKQVRIPGYLLPLELSADKVTEFLLVPYVGACIHVPPPPPNQIVHVKVSQKGGYKSEGLFDPVWVTGEITAKSMVKDLFLVDGSDIIDIGYTMQSNHIEPYQE